MGWTFGTKAAKRLALETLGWLLVVVGIAALVLPGPGLLALFAGLVLLSQQYAWAERRVEPVKAAALKGARDSVETIPRIVLSLFGVAWLFGLGIYWGLQPPAPNWWPAPERFWLIGGWGTGASLIGSSLIALAMIVWSWRTYRTGQGTGQGTGRGTDGAGRADGEAQARAENQSR